MRVFLVVALSVTLAACSSTSSEQSTSSSAAQTQAEQHAPTPRGTASRPPDHPGSLTTRQRSIATRIAKREQAKVTGTLIGATGFVTRGRPRDPGSHCGVNKRFLNVRLVWKADANFSHGSVDNVPPDGPRKEFVVTVNQENLEVCEAESRYRNVGADAGETLLYGKWPATANG